MRRIILNFFASRFGQVKSVLRSSAMVALLGVGILSATSSVSLADESGTSFWLPGTYGSLAAVPGTPGWAVASVYYHTTVSAGSDVAAAREIQIGRFNPTLSVNLNANLHASADLAIIVPSYTFATPVLGGQLAVQMGTITGSTSANVNGTLTASLPPFTLMRTDNIGDSLTGFGDLYPLASLKWNMGVNNFIGESTIGFLRALPSDAAMLPLPCVCEVLSRTTRVMGDTTMEPHAIATATAT
jgi:hypothetical protein